MLAVKAQVWPRTRGAPVRKRPLSGLLQQQTATIVDRGENTRSGLLQL